MPKRRSSPAASKKQERPPGVLRFDCRRSGEILSARWSERIPANNRRCLTDVGCREHWKFAVKATSVLSELVFPGQSVGFLGGQRHKFFPKLSRPRCPRHRWQDYHISIHPWSGPDQRCYIRRHVLRRTRRFRSLCRWTVRVMARIPRAAADGDRPRSHRRARAPALAACGRRAWADPDQHA
jgi:hypothetical protein